MEIDVRSLYGRRARGTASWLGAPRYGYYRVITRSAERASSGCASAVRGALTTLRALPKAAAQARFGLCALPPYLQGDDATTVQPNPCKPVQNSVVKGGRNCVDDTGSEQVGEEVCFNIFYQRIRRVFF